MTQPSLSPDSVLASAGAANALPGAIVAAVDGMGLLAFDGADAESFLQGQLSSDVSAMTPGAVHWTSYNSPKGRMLGTLLLFRAGPASFRAWVAAELAELLRKRLSMFVLRAKVTVSDMTSGSKRFGVAGPGAGDALRATFGAAPEPAQGLVALDCIVVATPDGRVLVDVPNAFADAIGATLAMHCGSAASEYWHWLGIRAGVPVISAATQDQFVPQTANWDLVGGINFRKGCYPGQEIVARMQYLGRLKERLFAFHVAAPPPAPATPLYHAAFGGQACGTVVNAAAAPEGGSDLLAVVQWAALADSALHLGAPEGPALAPLPLPYEVPPPTASSRPRL
ncbi:MAG: folate-binding protein [Casimicrobiaceae bacterium]